jgi:hypothetical protein
MTRAVPTSTVELLLSVYDHPFCYDPLSKDEDKYQRIMNITELLSTMEPG